MCIEQDAGHQNHMSIVAGVPQHAGVLRRRWRTSDPRHRAEQGVAKKETKVGDRWELQRIFVEPADAEKVSRARTQRNRRKTTSYAEDDLSE